MALFLRSIITMLTHTHTHTYLHAMLWHADVRDLVLLELPFGKVRQDYSKNI